MTAIRLAASVIVRNELGRYLEQSLGHLLEFCDEVAILDDASDDGTADFLAGHPDRGRLRVLRLERPSFFEHEGRARNQLLDWTLAAGATHVLAIDADEFVADGAAVRGACAQPGYAWTLTMEEIWKLDGDCLCVRCDGGWRPHEVPVLWRSPGPHRNPAWRINDRTLACGREPLAVRKLFGARKARPTGTELLHFGWACEADRRARYDRYVVADGGKFHASAHLQSIMWPDARVQMRGRPWPAQLDRRRAALERRAGAGTTTEGGAP